MRTLRTPADASDVPAARSSVRHGASPASVHDPLGQAPEACEERTVRIEPALLSVVLVACASRPTPPASEPAPYVHRFEHAEAWAKDFDDPTRDDWQKPDKVVAAMQLAPGMVVADVGAGTGYFESRLSAAVGATGRVLALDIEPDMVRHLGERASKERLANVEARLVAPGDPGLAPASVDRVLIVDTWHHIADRGTYSARLRASLKAGGEVVIVDFRADAHHGPPPAHRIPPEEVVRELSVGGLDGRIVEAGLPEQYVVVGALH